MRDTLIFRSTDPAREVVLLMNKDGSGEIVVTPAETSKVTVGGEDLAWTWPTRLNVRPPPRGQRIVMIHRDRAVEILYRDEEK